MGIRPQTQADLAKEVYSPMEPLVFGPDKKLCVYRCAPDLATLKWKKHLPKPPMALLSGLAVYKFFIAYSGFIWGLLPLLPILPLYGMQANINGNAEVQLEHIYLQKNGLKVEMTNLLGHTRVHPVHCLRKASDKEVLALHSRLGETLTERLQTLFPVIVHSATGSKNEKGEELRDCLEIVWVDHSGEIPDKNLLQAILNGQEIETSADATGADFVRSKEDQIDI